MIIPKREPTLVELFFLLCALFPWLSFGTNNLDTQPWPILGSIVYLATRKKWLKSSKFTVILIFSAISLLITLSDLILDFVAIRSFFSIATLLLVSYCAWLIKNNKVDISRALITSNIIWLLAGVLQKITNTEILSFLVTVRTTMDRGVTGLAPEPTFYAIFLFFISWILLQESDFNPPKKIKLLISINSLAIIFLAKSSMGLLYLLIITTYFLIYKAWKNPKILPAFIITLLAISYITFISIDRLGDSRISQVLQKLTDNPTLLIQADASVNERTSHMIYSVKGFLDDFGLPHGPRAFSEYWEHETSQSNGLFWYGSADKIMSWQGSLLYEQGFFGFIAIIIILTMFYNKNNKVVSYMNMTLFLTITLSAIPLAFTLPAMLIGLTNTESPCASKAKSSVRNKKKSQ
nr:hypothetical protein [uncultured Pseudogulbenkiania sp.]